METVLEPKADAPAQQPASTPQTPADKPVEKAPTPEELDAQRKLLVENFIDNPRWHGKKKKDDLGATEKPADQAEKKQEAAVPAPPKEPAKEEPKVETLKPAEVEKPTVIVDRKKPESESEGESEGDIQSRIDAAVAERMASRELPAEGEPAGPKVDPNHPDARVIEVVNTMARENPGRYDGLTDRIAEFRKVELDYKRQWMKDHPGEKFSNTDEQHSDFYSENQPTWSQRDFENAERSIERKAIKEELRAEVIGEIEPELKEIRFERQMAKAQPIIELKANKAMVSVLSVVPEFEAAMADGDKLVLSAQREKAMEEANPALYAIASEQSDRVIAVVTELEKMNQLGANYQINERLSIPLPNGDRIRPHAEIADVVVELEQGILREPPKDRMSGGKSFITVDERARRIHEIKASNLSDKAKDARIAAIDSAHWMVTAEDVRERFIARSRNRLQALAKRMPAVASKTKETVQPKTGTTATTEKLKETTIKPASNGSSATVSSSDVSDNRPGALKNEPGGSDLVLKRWFGS